MKYLWRAAYAALTVLSGTAYASAFLLFVVHKLAHKAIQGIEQRMQG